MRNCLNSGVAPSVDSGSKYDDKGSRERKSLIAASFSIESNLFVPRWGVKARDYDQFFSKHPL